MNKGLSKILLFFFRNTFLKEHLSVAPSVYFSKEASQGSIIFIRKIRLPVEFKCDNSALQISSRGVLTQGESNYLLVNKNWESSYFQVNNYWGVLFPEEYPAGNYMFKINNRNTRTRCEICLNLTIKTPERRHR